jgi:hypothetical protein
VPPEATSVAEYAAPTVPDGNEAVVIDGAPASTVKAVLPLMAPNVAEMVVVPGETAVATPEDAMVARAVTDEAHVT